MKRVKGLYRHRVQILAEILAIDTVLKEVAKPYVNKYDMAKVEVNYLNY